MEDSRSGICTRCIPEGSGRGWRCRIVEETGDYVEDDDDDDDNKGHAPELSKNMIALNGKSQTSY